MNLLCDRHTPLLQTHLFGNIKSTVCSSAVPLILYDHKTRLASNLFFSLRHFGHLIIIIKFVVTVLTNLTFGHPDRNDFFWSFKKNSAFGRNKPGSKYLS